MIGTCFQINPRIQMTDLAATGKSPSVPTDDFYCALTSIKYRVRRCAGENRGDATGLRLWHPHPDRCQGHDESQARCRDASVPDRIDCPARRGLPLRTQYVRLALFPLPADDYEASRSVCFSLAHPFDLALYPEIRSASLDLHPVSSCL